MEKQSTTCTCCGRTISFTDESGRSAGIAFVLTEAEALNSGLNELESSVDIPLR